MDSKILSSIKIEQLGVYLEYPDVHISATETFTEGHVFDKTDSKIPTDKIEQPGVYLEYPDFKPVKQELGAWCEDKKPGFGKVVNIASESNFMEMGGNTEPAVNDTEYKVLFNLENCSHNSEKVSSVIESNPFLLNKDFRFHTMGAIINHAQIPGGAFDFTVDSASSNHPIVQAAHMSDGCDPSVTTEKETQNLKKAYQQQVCGAAVTEDDQVKLHTREHNEGMFHSHGNFIDFITSFTEDGRNSHLSCHRRTQMLEKPYKCDDCGTSLASTGGMKYHMRVHRRETLQM